jgi:hypothetical protein
MEEISVWIHGKIYDTLFGSIRENHIIGAWSLESGVWMTAVLYILYGASLYHTLAQAG